jgi:hypothetical protein
MEAACALRKTTKSGVRLAMHGVQRLHETRVNMHRGWLATLSSHACESAGLAAWGLNDGVVKAIVVDQQISSLAMHTH